MWEGISIDTTIRKFFKQLTSLVECASWSLNSNIRKWFGQDGQNSVDINNFPLISLEALSMQDFFQNRWDLLWETCRILLK